jgi:methyltransferase (TIGR00027 family)
MARNLTACLAGSVIVGFALSVSIRAVEPGKPSVTALEVTAYRAIGAKHPDPAIRNGDYLAERFLGSEERAILKSAGSEVVLKALQMKTEDAWTSLAGGGRFAMTVHARTRHIDAVFEDALASGAAQAVILGAGLDSRAYRFRDKLRGARVFEVDFPPTQEYKKNRVRAVLGTLPEYVRYIPIDFATEDLATVLQRGGYDRTKKTVFVWEGVTFYIPEAAVDGTLRLVATHSAPGSRIVFDYFPASMITTPPNPAFDALAKRLAAMGEPFVFGFPDDAQQEFIARRGLTIASDVSMDEIRSAYLPKALSGSGAVGFVCTAVVPDRPR